MELLLSPKCFCRNWAVTMCSLNIRSMLIRRSCPTYFKKVYSSQTTRVARVSAASLGCPQVVSISQPQHRSSVAMAALEMTDERQSTEVDISMGASSTCEEPSQLDGGKGGGMSHIEEEAEEAKHYFEVAQSFFEYSLFMRPEIERRRRQVAQLASHHKALLYVEACSRDDRAASPLTRYTRTHAHTGPWMRWRQSRLLSSAARKRTNASSMLLSSSSAWLAVHTHCRAFRTGHQRHSRAGASRCPPLLPAISRRPSPHSTN